MIPFNPRASGEPFEMKPITPITRQDVLKSFFSKSLISVGVLCIGLTGCLALNAADDTTERHKNIIRQKRDVLQQDLQAQKKREIVTYVDKIWLGDTPRPFTNSRRQLPIKILGEKQVTLVTALPVDLKEVSKKIHIISGIKVEVEGNSAPPLASALQQSRQKIRYDGDLEGLLNVVADSFNAHWIYNDVSDTIYFTQMVTRIFDFYAPPNMISVSSSVSSGGGGGEGGEGGEGGGGGGGAGSISYSQSSSFDEWEDIQAAITNILPQNSRISLSKSTGKITITTSPRVMERVAEIIRKRNEYFTKQIHLGVQVLEFTVTGTDAFGVNLRNFNLGAFLQVALRNTLGFDVFSLATGNLGLPDNANSFTYTPRGGAANSSAVISALSTYGKVSILTTADTRTRNGKPTPIQSTSTRGFLESVQTTTADDGTQTTNFTPGSITTGFFMNVRPRVLDRERVQVDMSVAINTLNRIVSFGSGDTAVQQPDTSTQSFTQETIIPNKSTLIISGFERASNEVDRGGSGHPDNFLLGGRRTADIRRSMIIILITPTIVKS